MATIKLVLWNMEWMNDLFVAGDGPAQFRPDGEKPLHAKAATVKQRREQLSDVLHQLNPDIVVVVEGPSRQEELSLFFQQDVQGDWDIALQPGQTQNVGIAVRKDGGKFNAPAIRSWDTSQDKIFDPFLVDTDNDDVKEQHRFERRPLYVELSPTNGTPFRILGLHLKSKGIFTALEWSRWWDTADANRKKILAQAAQIRSRFLDPYLTTAATKDIPLIVCGDINDGPGMDASEKKLYGSGVERLMGNVWKPELCLGNAIFDGIPKKQQVDLDFENIHTTSFRDPIFNDMYQKEWIDHIMYSRLSQAWVSAAAIHEVLPDGKKIWVDHKFASDHLPVSVELSV